MATVGTVELMRFLELHDRIENANEETVPLKPRRVVDGVLARAAATSASRYGDG